MELEQIRAFKNQWSEYPTETVEIDGQTLDYFVLPSTLPGAPKDFVVHMHTGRREDEDLLGICETWPTQFRPYALIHERIHNFTYGGRAHACVYAVKEELELVPRKIKSDYINFRRDFFGSLIEWAKEQIPERVLEFQESFEYLSRL